MQAMRPGLRGPGIVGRTGLIFHAYWFGATPCHTDGMVTYRIVELNRDKISGWTVEGPNPAEKSHPRMLYRTREQAQIEVDRLTALESKKV